jgi:ribonuclease HII
VDFVKLGWRPLSVACGRWESKFESGGLGGKFSRLRFVWGGRWSVAWSCRRWGGFRTFCRARRGRQRLSFTPNLSFSRFGDRQAMAMMMIVVMAIFVFPQMPPFISTSSSALAFELSSVVGGAAAISSRGRQIPRHNRIHATAPRETRNKRRRNGSNSGSGGSLERLIEVENELHDRGYTYVIGSDDSGGAGCIAGPVVVASCCVLRPYSTFLSHITTTSSPSLSSSTEEDSGGSPESISQFDVRALMDVNDCKLLSREKRLRIYDVVMSHPNIFAISIIQRTSRDIDECTIGRVTQDAFAESIEALVHDNELPHDELYAIVDGNKSPRLYNSTRGGGKTNEYGSKIEGEDISPSRGVGGKATNDTMFPVRPYVNGDARVYAIALASIMARVTHDTIMEDMHALHPEYGFDVHHGYGNVDHVNAIHKYGAIVGVHRMSFKRVKGR